MLLAAAGLGMAAGGVEALAHTIRRRVMHRTLSLGRVDPPVDRHWKLLQQAYGPPPVSIDELGTNLDAYDGAITYLDGQIDALLRALASRGRLANTIIVVTSDHGELFGEHGVLTHGNSLFLPVLHIPLFMVAPGRIPVGARIPSIASLRDLPATLLDLAGVPNPGLPGHSLAGDLRAAIAGTVTDTLIPRRSGIWCRCRSTRPI